MILQNDDIHPISDFRHKIAELIEKTKRTKRPILITQNGKGTAVLVDVANYEELELLADIAIGLKDIKEKKVISNEEAKNMIKKNLK
ncbi:MAG: type II toxin-antitoxin system Phd/YefM family antitoxin [Ignavibacteriaceae bacterium]|nr:type II toxin-antitoxin system Phd/YefM family antitoxin [Ignavibacteriaceae bacterium]